MKEKSKAFCLERSRGKTELVVFLFYIVALSVVSFFHEPWFDEAQAWQIARCASIREILFEIPHYEGHPQLWHLLLVPFAKLGAPYEFSLYLVNTVFCAAAVWLILYKSPFPRAVRCLIPFNYFIFYHFGVMSRPYSMMLLAFALAAMTYQGRNDKPARYIFSLIFLCATSAYGMVIAGGLCSIWTVEIFLEYHRSRTYGKALSDKRAWLLLLILMVALFFLMSILPAEDCYYQGNGERLTDKLYRMPWFMILPLDGTIGCYFNYEENGMTDIGTVFNYILGCAVWLVLFMVMQANRKSVFFFVPYLLFCFSMLMVYPAIHHWGISALYMVFAFWVIWEENGTLRLPDVFRRVADSIQIGSIRILGGAMLVLIALISPLCSLVSAVNEIRYPFSMKIIAQYIKEKHIEDRKIMTSWQYEFLDDEDALISQFIFDETLPVKDFPEITLHRATANGVAATILPYFDHNIIMNCNADDPDCMYMKWLQDEDEHEEIYASWAEQGLPDFIFGRVPLQEIYSEEELEGVTYYWVDTMDYGSIWKLVRNEYQIKVYIRGDLLDEYPDMEIQKYATILNPGLTE